MLDRLDSITPSQGGDPRVKESSSQSVEQKILGAIKRIRYGSVEVILHDGKVVQIECKEKIRLDTSRGGHAVEACKSC